VSPACFYAPKKSHTVEWTLDFYRRFYCLSLQKLMPHLAITSSENNGPDAVPVPLPPLQHFKQSVAFALSALLSPYLVIPVGTVAVVASVSFSKREWLIWTLLSILFSTGVPAMYVLIQVWRGRITDIHVMEREQRGGPFLVAILSSAVGAFVLRTLGANVAVWGVGVVLAANGLVLFWISAHWKISMHVAVLSSTILAAVMMIDGIALWNLAWMVPALIWARVTRGRHTIWQGIGGCAVSSVLTAGVLWLLYSPYVAQFWPIFLRRL
jgi:hypothetical protein